MKTTSVLPNVLRKGCWVRAILAVLMTCILAADSDSSSADEPSFNSQRDMPTPVTLSVKNMDVKEILSMFSSSRNLNIICGSDVTGEVSIDLQDVPFDKALEAITAIVGAKVTHRGNIYFVSPRSGSEGGVPVLTQVKTYRLNYALPDMILPVLRELLTPVGRAMAYEPLRTIVIEDEPEVLERIGLVIGDLDLPPRQVLIEARIMEARLSRDFRLGIDWSLIFSTEDGSGDVVVEGFASPVSVGSEGLFITWGEGDFLGRLESMAGIEKLNTLAAPKLLAVDGTPAEIIIGDQLGFSVVSTVENTVIQSVEFLDVGAQLRLTPTITGDGYVLMNINPELSNGAIEEGLPSKSTAEVTTDVLIKDGHTLFIGGLIRERVEKTRKGIPLLMEIPLLGFFFGKTTHSVQKSELITLITPRIVEPGESIEYSDASTQ